MTCLQIPINSLHAKEINHWENLVSTQQTWGPLLASHVHQVCMQYQIATKNRINGLCSRYPYSKKNLLQLFSIIIAIAIVYQNFNVGSTCHNCCNWWTTRIVIDSWNCCNCGERWNWKSVVLHGSRKFSKFVHMISTAQIICMNLFPKFVHNADVINWTDWISFLKLNV
jgi:hypothetical protein